MLGGILVISAFMMYSSTFLSDYLMNDEWALLGNPNNIKDAARDYFFSMGRGLFGVYQYLVFKFAGYSPIRIQFLRFINIGLIALLALFSYQFLRKQVGNRELVFFLVLFWLLKV